MPRRGVLGSTPVPATTCIRCFAVFSSDDARPGVAPVCPLCATALAAATAAQPALAARAPSPDTRRIPRPVLFGGAAILVLLVALAVAVAARWIVL
jgi:hypothetical protein